MTDGETGLAKGHRRRSCRSLLTWRQSVVILFVTVRLPASAGRFAPDSNDKQIEYVAIQRFALKNDRELMPKGEGFLNLSRLPDAEASSSSDCGAMFAHRNALQKVIESKQLEQIWTPFAQPASP
jgi:hypothetical protein